MQLKKHIHLNKSLSSAICLSLALSALQKEFAES